MQEGAAEIVVGRGQIAPGTVIAGSQQRFFKAGDGLRVIAGGESGGAEVVAGDKVPARDVDVVGEHGGGVFPEGDLVEGQEGAGGHTQPGGQNQSAPEEGPASGQVVHSPGEQDAEADGGEVAEAVGHSLIAGLHQADDGDERAQEPKPADGQEWPRAPLPQDAGGGQGKQGGGAGDFPGAPVLRGIETGEVFRPKGLAQVADIGNRNIGQALAKGEAGEGLDRAGVGLSEECGGTEDEGQKEERDFIQEHARGKGAANRHRPSGQ